MTNQIIVDMAFMLSYCSDGALDCISLDWNYPTLRVYGGKRNDTLFEVTEAQIRMWCNHRIVAPADAIRALAIIL